MDSVKTGHFDEKGASASVAELVPPESGSTYEIVCSAELGRHMIAAKDFEMGEIIFEEDPLVTGPLPIDSDKLMCVECYESTLSKCEKCGLPICETHEIEIEGSGKVQHGSLECELLFQALIQKSRIDLKNYWVPLALKHLFVLRCLLIEPVQSKLLYSLDPNFEAWSKSPLAAQFINVDIKELKELFGGPILYFRFPSKTELCTVKAIQDINSYEILLPTTTCCSIQATYYLASMLEHNCVPNTHRITNSKNLKLTLRAARKIPKGSHLSTSYSDLFWPTIKRQKYFQETKFFTCNCSRCLDPTECGSLLSAFLCPNCPDFSPILSRGFDFPAESLTGNWKFTCGGCGSMHEYEKLMDVLQNAKIDLEFIEEVDEADEDDDKGAIPRLMEWLSKCTDPTFFGQNAQDGQNIRSLKLHPQNALVLDVCHTIFLLYSLENLPLSSHELTHKIQLGEHLLKSVSAITPGISKFRCTVMADLAKAKILRASILENNRDDPDTEFGMKSEYITSALRMWKEALDCLQYEPLDSAEGALAKSGRVEYQKYLPKNLEKTKS